MVLNAAIAGSLALLGFNSCGEEGEEYGTPHADFSFKGSVKSTDGKAIPGIQVTLSSNDEAMGKATTDENGKYQLNSTSFPTTQLRIEAKDIDGEANGSYQTKEVNVHIADDEFKGAKGWYSGKVEKDVDIQMEEQKTDE